MAPCAARLRDLKKLQKDWMSWRRRVLPQHSRQTVDNWIKIAQHRELTASAGNRPASVREALSIIKKALAESGWNTIVARDEQERRSEADPALTVQRIATTLGVPEDTVEELIAWAGGEPE